MNCCPLCRATSSTLHHQGAERSFWHCTHCDLVFVPSAERLAYEEEVARYRLHQNVDDDSAYIDFLSRLAGPVIERVPPGARGLDYGSGQSAALALILERSGRPTLAYDPAFRPDGRLLDSRYDFITCSEVLEHVHEPLPFLERLGGLLVPGGVIGIMTSLRDPAQPFGDWWYHRDPTHVCFCSEATMRWIAVHFGWSLELPAANVAIFRAPGHALGGEQA